MMKMSATRLRRISRAAIMVTAAIVTVTLVGCYWTPPEDEGGITISIDGHGVEGAAIGASATDSPDTFFFAQVASEGLLRGEPDVAEAAIAEANQELQAQFEELATDPNSADLDSFEVTVSVPDVQLQAAFLNLGDDTGSSSNFSGLRAGESYLVTVFAGRFDPETESNPDFNVGFATATITGGETQTVNLTLNATFENYAQFLFDEYGISTDDSTGDDGSTTTTSISVFPILADDAYAQVPPDPELFYDIIDASEDSIAIANHKVELSYEPGSYFVADTAGALNLDYSLAERLTQMAYISTDGAVIDASSGERAPLPSDSVITGVEVGTEIQLLLTTTQTRGTDSTNETAASIVGVTPKFTVQEDSAITISYYPWSPENDFY